MKEIHRKNVKGLVNVTVFYGIEVGNYYGTTYSFVFQS